MHIISKKYFAYYPQNDKKNTLRIMQLGCIMIVKGDTYMELKRKIYAKLLEWKETMSKDYALMIEGARRIGKSTIV